ncbi:MAG TPA: glycosyltransferase family 2 protein [Candidatus Paceibacterota bacterium]|nr:glycosyltransferase family 2 protein [Candidatus Paceibacterota bacterium]
MKVSIVIPAYNEEAYLGKTLEAALAQTHPDLEVIVVNNNSTDRTAQVAARFPGVRLVFEPRHGILFARECGRRAATGDVVVSMDADCIPHPAWVVNAVRYFSDPSVVAVSGPYDLYDAPSFFHWTHLKSQQWIFPWLTRLLYRWFGRGVIAMGGNTFARSSALAAIGGYNLNLKFYAEDMDTANRLATVGRVMYHNDVAIKTSARRYLKHGIMKIQYKYLMNYLWIVLFRKPFRNEFEE